MKYLAFYLLFSIFFTFFARIYHPFIVETNRYLIKSIVFISYPVTSFLDKVKVFTDRYVMLVGLKKENERLKDEITKLEFENRLLAASKCTPQRTLSINRNIVRGRFKFKNNFNIDYIFIKLGRPINLQKNYCSVFSKRMKLVGMIEKKEGDFYLAKTVFNRSFVADVYILSDNITYRALFIGDLYRPKAEFLDPKAKVRIGSPVYTSGTFGVFPRGSFIGRVSSVSNVNNYYDVAYIKIDKSFFNDWDVFAVCIKK